MNSLQLNTLHLVVFARWYQYYLFLPFFGIPEALKVYHSKHFVFQLSEIEVRWKTRLKRMRTISQPCFSGSGTLSLETRQLVFVEEAGFCQGVVRVCHVICLKHCFPTFKCDDKRMTVRKVHATCHVQYLVSKLSFVESSARATLAEGRCPNKSGSILCEYSCFIELNFIFVFWSVLFF